VGSGGQAGGAHGDVGVRACGGAPGSVDRLDHWVQVMDIWSITLGSGAIYIYIYICVCVCVCVCVCM
jgi:hypothetical protein